MELKTLIFGLFISTAAFALKSGGGLAYLFLRSSGGGRKAMISATFAAGYGAVFAIAALMLMHVDFAAHLERLQTLFKSGMTLHVILAFFLIIWGTILLKQDANVEEAKDAKETQNASRPTKTWMALVIPCPVCFSVILLSCSFVHALYPDEPMVFFALYAAFVLMTLMVAVVMEGVIRKTTTTETETEDTKAEAAKAKAKAVTIGKAIIGTGNEKEKRTVHFQSTPQTTPERLLGWLMLTIAVYFLLSVIIAPQFADLSTIYSLSLSPQTEIDTGLTTQAAMQQFHLLIFALFAFAAGFLFPLNKRP